jgi:excisionase family DNA binding protein
VSTPGTHYLDVTPLLCPKEVAHVLGTSERTARRLMASNQLESLRIGGKLLRTRPHDLAEYLEREREMHRLGESPGSCSELKGTFQ